MTLESVAKAYGFDAISVSFAPFTEPTVKWQRGYKTITMQIADYFEDAPQDVIDGLVGHVIDRIRNGEKKPYPDNVKSYLIDMMADMTKVHTYIERHGRHSKLESARYGGLIVRGTQYRELYSSIFLVAFTDRDKEEAGDRLDLERAKFVQGAVE